MPAPDTIIIDGRAYSWRALQEARRRQIAEWKASRPQQPALFELIEDRRPKTERTAAGRYQEPSLLSWIDEAGGS